MSVSHTMKFPWTAGPMLSNRQPVVTDADGNFVCTTRPYPNGTATSWDELIRARQNARLIEALPVFVDLLGQWIDSQECACTEFEGEPRRCLFCLTLDVFDTLYKESPVADW